jgi:dihydropteroate synthase
MGVVNVTPDSFSDGGQFLNTDAAIQHGLRLAADGADILDVGGESTRPGSDRVPQHVETERVLPVVSALARQGAVVSIDTMRASVARQAVGAGASMVNDVSGGRADPAMFAEIADLGVPYVLMHWRGHGRDMDKLASYADVTREVSAELGAQVDHALAAGVPEQQLILDPGFGFAKTGEHNWELLQHLDRLTAFGRPLLLGASRKRFLGTLLGSRQTPRAPRERDDATAALTWWAAQRGVWGVRVHAVRPSVDGLAVLRRLQTC